MYAVTLAPFMDSVVKPSPTGMMAVRIVATKTINIFQTHIKKRKVFLNIFLRSKCLSAFGGMLPDYFLNSASR